ncbi:hypothetical protein JCM5350_002827 [Sporobolomyces pararoseus]
MTERPPLDLEPLKWIVKVGEVYHCTHRECAGHTIRERRRPAITHAYSHKYSKPQVPRELKQVWCRYCSKSFNDSSTTMKHQRDAHLEDDELEQCTKCEITWVANMAKHKTACAKTDKTSLALAFRAWNHETLRFDYALPHLEELACAGALEPEPPVSEEVKRLRRFPDLVKETKNDLDAAQKRLEDVLEQHSKTSATRSSLSNSSQLLLPSRLPPLYFPS